MTKTTSMKFDFLNLYFISKEMDQIFDSYLKDDKLLLKVYERSVPVHNDDSFPEKSLNYSTV